MEVVDLGLAGDEFGLEFAALLGDFGDDGVSGFYFFFEGVYYGFCLGDLFGVVLEFLDFVFEGVLGVSEKGLLSGEVFGEFVVFL